MEFLCGSTGPTGTYVPTQLNPESAPNTVPVPFWNTNIVVDGSSVDFMGWNLQMNQEAVPFFACEHNSTPQAPKFMAVGPLTATFTGEYMFVTTSSWAIPDDVATLDINIGDSETIALETLEKTSDEDQVVGQEDFASISVDYHVYELVKNF